MSQCHVIDVKGQEPQLKFVEYPSRTVWTENNNLTRRGALRRVQIQTERRAGRKIVTRIINIEQYGVDPEAFSKEMRSVCAASTSSLWLWYFTEKVVNDLNLVVPLPGKDNTNVEVLVQGHVVDSAVSQLERYGIGKTLIEVLDKTSK